MTKRTRFSECDYKYWKVTYNYAIEGKTYLSNGLRGVVAKTAIEAIFAVESQDLPGIEITGVQYDGPVDFLCQRDEEEEGE
jgi:hypothetical protein